MIAVCAARCPSEHEHEAALRRNKSAPPPALLSIQQVFENCRKLSEDNLNPKTIIDKTTEFIALGDPPPFFSGRRSWISQVDGTFGAQVQSPQLLLYFADVSLPALYDAVATRILSPIDNKVSDISFSSGHLDF